MSNGAPRAKSRGPSTRFAERNPPKHILLRSVGASKGTLIALIHGLRDRGFLRRRVNSCVYCDEGLPNRWSLTGKTCGTLPNAHVGRHSPTKAGISIGGSSATGMMPGIPTSRKESHPERAKDNGNQFFHTFFYGEVTRQPPFYLDSLSHPIIR